MPFEMPLPLHAAATMPSRMLPIPQLGDLPPARAPRDFAPALSPCGLLSPATVWSLLAPALDEIDYGVVVVETSGGIVHVNRCATSELDATHPLQRHGRAIAARRTSDETALQDALRRAARGLRQVLSLGEPGSTVSVSVVPLQAATPGLPTGTLLLLGKRHLCDDLALHGYARDRGLTGAEARVLGALCRGHAPTEIARRLGVAVSTVRTQIRHIRAKTGTSSMRELVGIVGTLPPCRLLVEGSAA